MARGTYLDSIRKSPTSAPAFLKSFAEERVQAPKQEQEQEISPREKLMEGFKDESLSGAKRMMLGAALGASYLAGRGNTRYENEEEN